MKKIKKSIKYLLYPLSVIGFSISKSFAACTNGQLPDPFNPNCDGSAPTIGDIASKFVPVIPVVLGLVLFGVIVWGSFQVFTAGPNDDSKKKGFQTIQNAITGAVLLLVSVGIITLLESILGVKILYGFFVK